MKKVLAILFSFCVLLNGGCTKKNHDNKTGDIKEPHYHNREEAAQAETETKTEIEEIDLNVYWAEFENAKENGDYVAMNNAYKVLEENGAEPLDYTHGGILKSYEYSYTGKSGTAVTRGNVYILKLPYNYTNIQMEEIADRQTVGEHDYVVIDYRHVSDPNMQVRDSYKCDNVKERGCVIDILLLYEKENDTLWERSKPSMEAEWSWHNLAYIAGYEVERAKHVDFNNADEG